MSNKELMRTAAALLRSACDLAGAVPSAIKRAKARVCPGKRNGPRPPAAGFGRVFSHLLAVNRTKSHQIAPRALLEPRQRIFPKGRRWLPQGKLSQIKVNQGGLKKLSPLVPSVGETLLPGVTAMAGQALQDAPPSRSQAQSKWVKPSQGPVKPPVKPAKNCQSPLHRKELRLLLRRSGQTRSNRVKATSGAPAETCQFATGSLAVALSARHPRSAF